jgi:hypothetical protein
MKLSEPQNVECRRVKPVCGKFKQLICKPMIMPTQRTIQGFIWQEICCRSLVTSQKLFDLYLTI